MKLSPNCAWSLTRGLLLAPTDAGAGPGGGGAPVSFETVTPNLVVSDIAASMAFYRDVLGFQVVATVPEQPPFVFAMLVRDGVTVMLNDRATAEHDLPAFKGRPLAGGATMYFKIHGVDAFHASLRDQTSIVLPLVDQFYGMREFAVADPDGYLLIFAEEKK